MVVRLQPPPGWFAPPPYTCTRSFIARGGSPRFCSFHQLFFCFCPSTCFLRGVSQWTEMEMVKKRRGKQRLWFRLLLLFSLLSV